MKTKVRVLHIGLAQRFGGIESFLLHLCREMYVSEYAFTFVSYSSEAARETDFLELGDVIKLRNRNNPIAYFSDLKDIYSNGYDIIHVHKNSATDPMPFLCAKYANGARIIAHAHNSSTSFRLAPLISPIGQEIILRTADKKLACSTVAGEWLYGDRANIDCLVPNGVQLDRFAFNPATRIRLRREMGIGDEIIIGCVGRFVTAKNQEFVLEIIKVLASSREPTKALFLGDGFQESGLPEAFSRAGLAENAIFAGAVQNVNEYMQAMDVMVMPSLYEGLPIVAVEAQAACLPVILSDNITHEVCLSDNTEQLSIKGENAPRKWADKTLWLARHCNRAGALDSRMHKFDLKHTVEVIGSVYDDVLGQRESIRARH